MSEEEENRARDAGRPPVIPFDFSDFARDDIIPKEVTKSSRSGSSVITPPPATVITSTSRELKESARPTGYSTQDDGDEEPEQNPLDETDSGVSKLFKDLFIASPYDSRRRQQAKYVVRNITGIAFLIGAIFTGLWYFSPVKFVSYRGSSDSTVSTPQNQINDLINIPTPSSSDSDYFDLGVAVPNENFKRIPIPSEAAPPSFRSQNI
jgi:hypothetical protein